MRVTKPVKNFARTLEKISTFRKFFLTRAEKSAPLAVCFVDNVEKLSTEMVDNYISLRYISVEMWITIYRRDIFL